ncbi:SGNH/GDSL hydrolase family protein [Methylocaldum szegediense]|uniref:SGNH/GDSL hydrolase family protein n=1 Tax=Methylocaldum szegediense TaxID=73780 RepID=UPI0003F9D859|nr:SGNH/GDSL hydrolase family protein [Methylocaldum szegediense]
MDIVFDPLLGKIRCQDVARGRVPVMVGAVGDSLIYGGQISANYYAHGTKSIVLAAARQANYSFLAGPNDGTGGLRVDQLLEGNPPIYPALENRVPLNDRAVTHVMFLGGTNDVGQGVATAKTIDDIRRAWDRIDAKGKTPIAATIPPRNTADTAIISRTCNLNNAIRRFAAIYGLPCADIFEECVDYTYGAGMAFKAGYFIDNVHLSSVGSWHAGNALRKALQPLVGDDAHGQLRLAMKTSPVNNTDQKAINGLFNTYTGTINTTGSTADVSGSYWQGTVTLNGGATQTIQDQATADPNVGAYGNSNVWRFDVPAGGSFNVNSRFTAPELRLTGFQPGDRIAFSINFAHRPGGAGPTGNGQFQVGISDRASPGTSLMTYKWAQVAENTPAKEHIDPGLIDCGQIYMERIFPELNFDGSTPAGIVEFYIACTANGGIATPASLSIANVGIWNLRELGMQ